MHQQYSRFIENNGPLATQAYVDLAHQCKLDPAQMALAFVNSRSFVGSTIIGSTSLDQLKSNIDSINICLDKDVVQEIEAIHQQYTYPCP